MDSDRSDECTKVKLISTYMVHVVEAISSLALTGQATARWEASRAEWPGWIESSAKSSPRAYVCTYVCMDVCMGVCMGVCM